MKKPFFRNALLVLLVAVSAMSYLYLNNIDTQQLINSNSSTYSIELEEEKLNPKDRIVFPDLNVIIKIIEAGKRFVPLS